MSCVALGEFELIRRFFNTPELAFRRAGVLLGIGDDAAVITPSAGVQLLMSMDLLQENVHFPARCDGFLLGQRALLVNLSDLAAMGADPLCFTLGLSLPAVDEHWLDAFSCGLAQVAAAHNCPLVGGDITRGPLGISIQVHGQAPVGTELRRSGARVGDVICVTGTLGDAAAALPFIVDGAELPAELSDAWYCPDSRVAAGLALRGLASAAIDVSDGLQADLGHILTASEVGAEVNVDELPLSETFRQTVPPEQWYDLALTGGDDYELCFTVSPDQADQAVKALAALGVNCSRIGRIVAGNGIRWFNNKGAGLTFRTRAYTHFRAD